MNERLEPWRTLFLVKGGGGALQETLRTAVGVEEGKGRFANQRTDEDDFDGADGQGNPPELGDESAGEEQRKVEIEVDYSSGFIF